MEGAKRSPCMSLLLNANRSRTLFVIMSLTIHLGTTTGDSMVLSNFGNAGQNTKIHILRRPLFVFKGLTSVTQGEEGGAS